MLLRRKKKEDASAPTKDDKALKNPCKRLGDILTEEGAITKEQLEEALEYRKKNNCFLGQALVELEHLDQDSLVSFLVKQCKIPHLSLLDYNIDSSLLAHVPQETCEKYSILPIDKLGKILTVAMIDPLDIEALEAVRTLCPDLRVKPILCNWQHYKDVTAKLFGKEDGEGGAEVSSDSFGLAPEPVKEDSQDVEATEQPDEAGTEEPETIGEQPEVSTDDIPKPTPIPQTAVSATPAMSGPTVLAASEDLVSAMRETLRETLGSLGEQIGNTIKQIGAAHVQAPDENLATTIHDSIRSAMQESMSEFTEQLKSIERVNPTVVPEEGNETASPVFSTRELANAVRDGMSEVMATLSAQLQNISPGQATEQPMPPPQDLVATVRDGVGEAMAGLTEQLQNMSSNTVENQPLPSTQELADAVRDSVGSVMHESMSGLSEQIQKLIDNQSVNNADKTAQELANAVQTSIQNSMHDAISTLTTHTLDAKTEAEAVADAFRADLEKVLPKKRKKGHASVMPFGQGKDGALAALDSMEPDERVLSGLDSAHPLTGFDFDNFFPGKENQFTYELCKAVSVKPGNEYNPFFLYGNVGLGKTHLINAIGNEISTTQPDYRVGYVSASHFSKCLKDAVLDNALDAFRENYCHWDCLILDDIQFLGGKIDAQEEFFHIFNVLHQEQRQIIIAADKAPTKLGLLEQRLVSRFSGGLVSAIKYPDRATRIQILTSQMEMLKVNIPDEVLMQIAIQVPEDVRKMIGAFRKIVAFAKLVGQDVSCEMADEILGHLVADVSIV